jgi:hypothetical protein
MNKKTKTQLCCDLNRFQSSGGGIIIASTPQFVVFATFEEHMHPSVTTEAVEKLGEWEGVGSKRAIGELIPLDH